MSTHPSQIGQTATSQLARVPNLTTVVWRSLVVFRPLHIALACGIAAATAVIVGALVVGDSVRGSLQGLVLERLGNVQSAMLSQRFFDPAMLENATRGIGPVDYHVLPAIVLPSVAVELRRDGQLQRAAQVQALGIEPSFWKHATADKRLHSVSLGADEVALNASLANELGARVGDEVTLRLPKGTGVPADSPLGRRDEASASLPGQRVAVILPDHSVADLDFRAGQQATRNLFAPLSSLQDALERSGRANAALVTAPAGTDTLNLERAKHVCAQMNERITPSLADYGLKLERHTRVFPDEEIGEEGEGEPRTIFDYFQITSDQLILDDLTSDTLYNGLQEVEARRAMTYLVNEIASLDRQYNERPLKVTYSIVVGLEDSDPLTANFANDLNTWGQRRDSCAVNSWLAERLDLQVNSNIRITYFEPETIEGREVERTHDMVVTRIVPITTPSTGYRRNRPAVFTDPPTAYNDPNLTPVVPGITDQDSISKWDLPFKLTREIPKEDDAYWQDHRLTPKIFMRYAPASEHFGSRFGRATALRIDAAKVSEEQLRQRATEALLAAKPGLGLVLEPIRQLQLQSASGTTPFDGLFLALSFFVIIAALMLVALLFRLSIEQRASQWGILMATGFQHGRVRSLLLRESAVVVAAGVALGLVLGLGYARLMIAGLESWWIGAVSSSFLDFTYTARSMFIGGLAGGLASLVTIVWTLWRLNRKQPLDLLRGRWDETHSRSSSQNKVALALAGFLFFGALGLLILGMTQTGMAQAGSFFGCGMLLLCAALVAIKHALRNGRIKAATSETRPGLWGMSWLNLTRNPWRSVLTVGLLAFASFLIASMSIFQIAPSLQGSGGFELMGESSLPLYRDLGSTRVREDVLSAQDFDTLRTASILSFRARIGEDASCNNLYKVAQPTVLGVSDALMNYQMTLPEEQRFQWAAADRSVESPWQSLAQVATGSEEDPIPVIMDLNTAAWSLHQGAALNEITKLQYDDQTVFFKTVGLLSNSVLQGKLLIGEQNFKSLFPEINGYRFFLIHSDDKPMAEIAAAMENGWSDEGLDVSSTEAVLAKLLSVQNTYISAFQSIGALGLLLGTFGLAVVQVRSVLERRRELALMQAIGFSRARIAQLLLSESTILLLGGVLIGVLAAMLAIVPFMLGGTSRVNYLEPLLLLAIVLSVGLLASTVAVVAALRQPLLTNLQ